MTTTAPAQTPIPVPVDPRRWIALAAVAGAQLMIGLDLTIMNIALPSLQSDLSMSDADRQWVISAFALAYGGTLLLGGRLSERVGRKTALVVGLTGFALASAVGGAAVNTEMLLGARGAQGLFGALMTPSVLATLALTFPLPAERAKAFGIYGTVMGSSSGLGVLLGGVLTEYADWRWCMFVNLPIAAGAGAAALCAVRPTARVVRPIDLIGAVLATGGLMSLVLGFARAQTEGWTDGTTIGALVTGVIVLTLFVATQSYSKAPLLPLSVVLDRRRGGSYLAVFALAVGMFAALFFLTFYLQEIRDYSAVKSGLMFLPLTVGLMAGVRIAGPVLARSRAIVLLPAGLVVMASGLVLLATADADSGYWLHVMPVFLLIGLGTGWVLITANSTATMNAGADTAVAGAMVMTSQQVGAALGTALLSTIAATSTNAYLAGHRGAGLAGVVHGFQVASWWGAGMLVVAALLVLIILPTGALGRPKRSAEVTPDTARIG